MSIFSPNNVGTVRFNSGSATINGTGTFFKNFRAGSVISIPGIGSMQLAADPTSDTVAIGVVAWGGVTTTFRAFEYRPRNEEGVFTDKLVQLLNQLSNGNIQAFTGLALAANKLLYANGSGTLGLQDFAQWAQSMLALTGAANKLPYLSASNAASLTDLTAKARELLAAANVGDMQTVLGVSAFIKGLLDDANAAAARATLALPWEPLAAGSLAGLAATPLLTLPAGYKRFKMLLQGANWGTSTALLAQLGTASGGLHSGASDYVNTRFFTGAVLDGGQHTSSAAFLTANSGDTIATAQWLDADIDIYPGGSGTALIRVRSDYRNSAGNHRTLDGGIRLVVGGVKDRFIAFPAGGGTTFAAGDYTLLGLRN